MTQVVFESLEDANPKAIEQYFEKALKNPEALASLVNKLKNIPEIQSRCKFSRNGPRV